MLKNTPQIGLYEKALPNSLTLNEKLVLAKDIGFDFFEISIDESDEKLARLDWDKKNAFSAFRLNKRN